MKTRIWCTVVAIMAGFAARPLAAVEGRTDFLAAEDAAYQTIKQLTHADVGTNRIAFVGLFGKNRDLVSVYRSGLVRTPGRYEFYVRDSKEWDQLIAEIEFGERRQDVMDKETIQQFGQIKGVQALLYGDILEATVSTNGALLRLAMTLADVQTGQVLWTGNVVGRYQPAPPVPAIPEAIRKAAMDAGRKAAAAFQARKNAMGHVNVYLLPLRGQETAYAPAISDIVGAELVGDADNNVHFFSRLSNAADERMMRRISEDLAPAGTGSMAGMQDLKRITLQLQQLFQENPAVSSTAAKSKIKKAAGSKNAVLSGTILEAKSDVNGTGGTVSLNLNLLGLPDNAHLWGANIDGRVEASPREIFWLWTQRHIKLIGIVAVALFGLIVLAMFFRAMRRPR